MGFHIFIVTEESDYIHLHKYIDVTVSRKYMYFRLPLIMNNDPLILVKISVIGDTQVGKFRLIECFSARFFTNFCICSVGCDFVLFTQSVVRLQAAHKILKPQIWDTVEQECYRTSMYSIYNSPKGLLLAYDIINRTSFDRVCTWTDNFR